MAAVRAALAERWKTPVRLDLAELNLLLDAALDAGADERRAAPDLKRAAAAVRKARNRRLAAVQRAGR